MRIVCFGNAATPESKQIKISPVVRTFNLMRKEIFHLIFYFASKFVQSRLQSDCFIYGVILCIVAQLVRVALALLSHEMKEVPSPE